MCALATGSPDRPDIGTSSACNKSAQPSLVAAVRLTAVSSSFPPLGVEKEPGMAGPAKRSEVSCRSSLRRIPKWTRSLDPWQRR
jgi:hypothetical protein